MKKSSAKKASLPHTNLSSTNAIAKIRELATSARTCFFGTHPDKAGLDVRPMAIQDVDREGNLWFLSARSSLKNRHIARNPRVQLLFANVGDSEYLDVRGTATISDDRQLVKAHWTPIAKTWFHEGIDDPEVTVVKVKVDDGYYWDTAHGKALTMIQIAVGAVTGKTYDDGVQGTVRPTRRQPPRRVKKQRGRVNGSR